MFEKQKAIVIYKKLLNDLNEVKRIMQNSGEYDGFDRGYAIVSKKYVNEKLNQHLSALADQEGYNLSSFDVQHSSDGREATMYIIDNESEEYKAARQKELKRIVNSGINYSNENKSKIINIADYKRKVK